MEERGKKITTQSIISIEECAMKLKYTNPSEIIEKSLPPPPNLPSLDIAQNYLEIQLPLTLTATQQLVGVESSRKLKQ